MSHPPEDQALEVEGRVFGVRTIKPQEGKVLGDAGLDILIRVERKEAFGFMTR